MTKTKFNNIVIFGASKGIGKAITLEYASLKSNLILLSRNIEAMEGLSKDINNFGGRAYFKKCDISVKNDVESGIVYSKEKLGTIDLAIINSGIGVTEWMGNFNSNNLKKIYETNIFGIAYALEYLIPLMKQQGFGTIAGVSSLADSRGYPGSASYCSSKAAASTLLESARVELKKFNIDVITIKPGFVKTDMTAKNEFYMPCLMNVEKAAKIIVKGLERKKKIVQFPFVTVNLTRFIKLVPNFIYDPIARKARPSKN